MAGRMENPTLPAQLPEQHTDQRQILGEVAQLLKYIYGAHTLNRQELATTVLGVTTKCLNTLSNEKLKVILLEAQVDILYEELEHAKERLRHFESILENAEALRRLSSEQSQVDQSPLGPMAICSSTSEYEVQALLGNGTYGTVLRCWKKPSNEIVALKMIKDQSYIRDAIEEVKILDSLKALGSTQFNIISCNEAFMFEGHFCIEFENLDINLLDYIRSQGFLRLREIRPIIQQLAVALWFLEDAGVVHADLKPENIMLVDRHRQPLKLQVIDFGLALRNPEKWTGKTLQTLWYRAPEVLLGAPFNHSTDVWSLGCIAAEMLRGTPLFPANDEKDMLQRIISIVGKPPDDLLELGLNTREFFQGRSSRQRSWGASAKSISSSVRTSVRTPHKPSTINIQDLQVKLEDLLKAPVAIQTRNVRAAQCDWKCFTDLVEKMLHPNHVKRITHTAILTHPFIKMSHLHHQNFRNYVDSSLKCMEVCEKWKFDRAESAQRPSLKTTTFNYQASADILSELSQGPQMNRVHTGGAKRSCKERHIRELDHLDLVDSLSRTSSKHTTRCCEKMKTNSTSHSRTSHQKSLWALGLLV